MGRDRKNQNSWEDVMAVSSQHKFMMTAGDNKKRPLIPRSGYTERREGRCEVAVTRQILQRSRELSGPAESTHPGFRGIIKQRSGRGRDSIGLVVPSKPQNRKELEQDL
jgi:hypothetical protein